MTDLIRKYYNTDALKELGAQKKYDEESFNLFIDRLDHVLKDEENSGLAEEEENYSSNVLRYVVDYMDELESQKKMGFSIPWSKEYASVKLIEDDKSYASFAGHAVYKDDPVQALKDITLYARYTKRDELFIKHFMFLMENDGPHTSPSPERQAETYSEIYKHQLQLGKSEIFADKYANLMAMEEYSEIGCLAEAAEYEKAIKAGYSQNYAETFSTHLSEYIADYFTDYDEAKRDELVLAKAEELENKFGGLK